MLIHEIQFNSKQFKKYIFGESCSPNIYLSEYREISYKAAILNAG